MMIYGILCVYLLISTMGLVFVRMGAAYNAFALSKATLSLTVSHYTWIGLALYGLSFLLWILLLQRFNLSYISPLIAGISCITITLAAYFILHETITPLQFVGIAVIIIGLLLMNYEKIFKQV